MYIIIIIIIMKDLDYISELQTAIIIQLAFTHTNINKKAV